MGMGKTIMLSALIQSEGTQEELETDAKSDPYKKVQLRLNNSFRPIARSRKSKQGPTATLIVAPASLLNQWAEELKRSSEPGTMEVTIWHGQNRLDLEAAVDDQGDDEKIIKVIITSYGVLASEHAKLAKSDDASCPVYDSQITFLRRNLFSSLTLLTVTWLRVVLDEAHHCKSRQSKTAKAVFALRARRRWAVTGKNLRFYLRVTINLLDTQARRSSIMLLIYILYCARLVTATYSMLNFRFLYRKFLDFAPWSNFSFFRSFMFVSLVIYCADVCLLLDS